MNPMFQKGVQGIPQALRRKIIDRHEVTGKRLNVTCKTLTEQVVMIVDGKPILIGISKSHGGGARLAFDIPQDVLIIRDKVFSEISDRIDGKEVAADE